MHALVYVVTLIIPRVISLFILAAIYKKNCNNTHAHIINLCTINHTTHYNSSCLKRDKDAPIVKTIIGLKKSIKLPFL